MRLRSAQLSEPAAPDELSLQEKRPQRPSRRISNFIFFALLALLGLVSIPYGSVEPWWRALFECLIFALAALFLIDISTKGDWNVSRYGVFWPLFVLALFAFIQTIPLSTFSSPALPENLSRTISADPHGTRNWAMEMVALILLAMMLLRYTNQRRFKWLVYVTIGIAVLSAIFGVYRQMAQHQPGFGLAYLRPGIGYAQFINKNHFAFLIEMALGLVIGLIVWRGVSRERLLLAIALVILFGGAVVLSNSRGGILGMVCEFVFTALLFSVVPRAADESLRDKPEQRWARQMLQSQLVRACLMIVLVVIVAMGVIWIGRAPLATSLESLPKEIGAPADSSRWPIRRWDLWPETWNLIKDHPVAGVGFGGYWMAFSRYHNASEEMTPQEAHNDYLEFLASGGIAGLAIGVWFVVVFARGARTGLRSRDRFRRAARCGAVLGLSGVAVHSFVDFGLHIPANAAVFIVLIVISTVEVSGRNQKDRATP